MKKYIAIFFAVLIAFMTLCYLVGALVMADFNIAHWTLGARAMTFIIGFLLGILLSAMLTQMVWDHDHKN